MELQPLDMTVLMQPLVPLAVVNPLIPAQFHPSFDRPKGMFAPDEDDPLQVYQQYLSDPHEDLLWKIQYYRALRFQTFAIDRPLPYAVPEPINLLAFYRVAWLLSIKNHLGKVLRQGRLCPGV